MDGAITWQVVVSVGGLLIALIGMGFGFWKYFEGKIERTRSDANIAVGGAKVDLGVVAKELATYQRHVAETYVTKAGMQEQTMQILKAIDGMSGTRPPQRSH